MSEGGSAARAALKTAERLDEVARREEAPAKAVREQPRSQEERKTRGDSPGAVERAEATVAGSHEELATLNDAGMHAALHAGEAMLKATSSLVEELTNFAYQRLRADIETSRSLMSSSSDLGQAFNLQGQFAADAMRDYLEEMTRIVQLATQTTREVWAPLQEFSARLARGEVGRPS
jgi:hypothetical protein